VAETLFSLDAARDAGGGLVAPAAGGEIDVFGARRVAVAVPGSPRSIAGVAPQSRGSCRARLVAEELAPRIRAQLKNTDATPRLP
jgi:hypothetical protein